MDVRLYGRPRALDAKKMRELLDLVGHGSSVEEAARVVGVSLRTVQREAKDKTSLTTTCSWTDGDEPASPGFLVAGPDPAGAPGEFCRQK